MVQFAKLCLNSATIVKRLECVLVLFSVEFLPDFVSFEKIGFCLFWFLVNQVEVGQVVDAGHRVWMSWTEDLLVEFNDLLISPLCSAEISLCLVEHSNVVVERQ